MGTWYEVITTIISNMNWFPSSLLPWDDESGPMNSVILRIQRSGGGGAIQPSRDMSHTFKCQPLNLQGIDSLCFFTKGSLEKNMKNRSRVKFFSDGNEQMEQWDATNDVTTLRRELMSRLLSFFSIQAPFFVRFVHLKSAKRLNQLLRSDSGAQTIWNLSVARQIKTMNTIVEVSRYQVKMSFQGVFRSFFFPCFVQAFGVTHLHMLVLSG